MPRSRKRRHGCKLVCHFLENSCSSSSPGSALLVRCVEGDCVPVLQTPLVHSAFCTSSGWCPPTTAVLCLEGPAGPAWRREGGPPVPSPATWLPRGEGGVEGGGAEEAGQREKETFSLLFFSLVFLFFLKPSVLSFTPFFLLLLTFTLCPCHPWTQIALQFRGP